jgi:hypothetical protein
VVEKVVLMLVDLVVLHDVVQVVVVDRLVIQLVTVEKEVLWLVDRLVVQLVVQDVVVD